MTELVLTLISAALLNNFVLHWPLGVAPLLAGSRRQVHALGLATLCLMMIVGVIGQAIWQWMLVPLQLEALRLFVFLPLSVLLIAPLLKLLAHGLPDWPFEGLWPLLLGNAGVLGLALISSIGRPRKGRGVSLAAVRSRRSQNTLSTSQKPSPAPKLKAVACSRP